MIHETPSKKPATNIHYLAGALRSNLMAGEMLITPIRNLNSDCHILLLQLRNDLQALGDDLDTQAIRAELDQVHAGYTQIGNAYDRLREIVDEAMRGIEESSGAQDQD